jgi:hypothetical protein
MITPDVLKKLIVDSHQNAINKGFWEVDRPDDEKLMLIVSELGEAQEAHRKGLRANLNLFENLIFVLKDTEHEAPAYSHLFEYYIKDTFEDEVADCIIRMCDWCGRQNSLGATNIDFIVESIPSNIDVVTNGAFGAFTNDKDIALPLLATTTNVCKLFPKFGELTAIEIFAQLFVIAKGFNIDIMKHIEYKMKYNATRKKLHGKSY